jgi:hypothetical protein
MNSKVVFDFVRAINYADIESLTNLMTDDHVFFDSQENKMQGKENLRQAWIAYFELFPDYKIEIAEIIEKDPLVCILGYASGTYKNINNENLSNHWRIPAAWKAILEGNQIKHWQVYADNTIVLDIINRNK